MNPNSSGSRHSGLMMVTDGLPRPIKAIRSPTPVKAMHIVFFDVQGLLIDHAVLTGMAVNGD